MSRPSKMTVPLLAGTSPADRLEQRRLAGPVGAEQGDDLALVDLEVDVEQHLHVAVAHVQAPDEQHLGPALAPLVQHLAAGRGRRPHLRRCRG